MNAPVAGGASAAVEFDYAPTADEFYDAMTTAAVWGTLRLSVLLLFGIPLIAFAGFAGRYPDEAWNFAGLLLLYVAACGVGVGLVVWRAVGRLRRLARTQADAMRAEGLRMTLSEDAFQTRSPNISNTIRWPAFASVRTTKKNLVLRLRTGGTVPIPLRYLDEPARRFILAAVGTSKT